MKKLATLYSCLCLSLFANNAGATVTTWDPIGASETPAPTSPTVGGYTGSLTGTWESSSWGSIETPTTPGAWVESTAALFACNANGNTPAFTVTMNANHTVAGVFNGPLTPDPCNVTINGTGVMTIGPATALQGMNVTSDSGDPGLLTISNVIAGTANICAEANGQFFINGTNTWTGGTLLGFNGGSFTGIWNFNNSASFGTGGIYFSNCVGGALAVEGTVPVTIPNGVTNVTLATGTANLNIVGLPAPNGPTFSGPWTLSGGKEPPLNSGGTPASYSAVSLGSGGSVNNVVTISGVISGTNALTKYGVGVLQLTAANTYSGVLTVNNGTLQLSGSGAINNVSTLNIATNGAGVGGTLDVSLLPSPYILSGSTTLAANGNGFQGGVGGTGGTSPVQGNVSSIYCAAGGSFNLGSQPLNLTFSGTTSGAGFGANGSFCLCVSQGALTFNNNTIIVNNQTGTPLGGGTYCLIYLADGVSTISGTPNPNVFITGGGLGAGRDRNPSS